MMISVMWKELSPLKTRTRHSIILASLWFVITKALIAAHSPSSGGIWAGFYKTYGKNGDKIILTSRFHGLG
jgi:hypothetical protein